jgi:hypothetical protein
MSPQAQEEANMAILVKLSLASLVAGWITLAVSLPSPIPESRLQATPTSSTNTAKQPDTAAKPVQPQPNPNASGKYHVGDGVTAPKLIYSVPPELSEKLLKKKTNAPESCTVSITVDIDGNVKDVHVLTSTPDISDKKLHDGVMEMQSNCTKAAKQYRFEPGTYQGKPVPIELRVEMSFYH